MNIFDFKKNKKRVALNGFTIHLVEHCNLNCCGCDHCAPLANAGFLDIEIFNKDFERMSKLFDYIDQVILMGGEPLLHPDLLSFLKSARTFFPKSLVGLFTNGILLPEQTELFWQTCREYNIQIIVTKYPIDVDYAYSEKQAERYNMKLKYVEDTDIKSKKLYKSVFDLEGQQDPEESFNNCFHMKAPCAFLDNGKFYPCTVVRNSKNFSEYFNKELNICENDYIDIYKVKSGNEILEFLKSPIPFCKYCNVKERTGDHPWQKSKKEISEWT